MSESQVGPSNDSRPAPGRLIAAARTLPAVRDPYAYGELGLHAGYGVEAPAELGLHLREYWRILNKRKWLILSVVAVFVILGTVRTLMMTPLYTATVRLQIDRTAAKVVEGGNTTPGEEGGGEDDFLKTQYELLLSRAIAQRVVSALNLGDDANLFEARQFSPLAALKSLFASSPNSDRKRGARSDRERTAVGIVLGSRSVSPVSGSRLVDVSYTDPDPGRAQRIANALADAFIAANLDKRFEANTYAKTFLNDQVQQLKLRLEASEKQLLEFAQKEQIVAVTEKSSIAENNLASANAALGNLVSERIKNEQLWNQVVSTDATNLPQFLTNQVIEGLRAQKKALTTEYQEKLETYKPGYPAMVQITNKIKEVDRQLAQEVQTIKDSLKAAYEGSKSQEAEMKKQIETLRAEVLDLQKRSIQYNSVKHEVDTNRKLYEGLLQRLKEVDVAGGSGANNVFIVDKAELPGAPSSPNLPRALLLAFVLGLGAAIAAAYGLEHVDDRVQRAEDVERITGLTTLGIIPKVAAEATIMAELGEPRSALSEAYRSLCTALQFATENGLPKTLLITSSGPSEGKSITSLAIARHFAVMGLKVLLVDADLRKPSLHLKLECDSEPGLSTYLIGSCTPPEAFQRTATTNLALMASGPLPPNAADLLGTARFLSLLSVGLEVFDLIVVDGPPVMGIADAPLLANATVGSLFVVGAGEARSAQIRGAIKRLQLGRSPVLGTVLTKFDAKAAGYGYGYGYGYGDGHAYEEYKSDGDGRRPVVNGYQPQLTRADMGG